MTDFDNLGQVALWKQENDNPKAPVLKGSVIAHRNIKAGEALDIALWRNESGNSRAPTLKGKVSDKRATHERRAEPAKQEEDFDDSLPF